MVPALRTGIYLVMKKKTTDMPASCIRIEAQNRCLSYNPASVQPKTKAQPNTVHDLAEQQPRRTGRAATGGQWHRPGETPATWANKCGPQAQRNIFLPSIVTSNCIFAYHKSASEIVHIDDADSSHGVTLRRAHNL